MAANPPVSPDLLKPASPPTGVRRLSRRPLFIGLGGAGVLVAIITYTLSEPAPQPKLNPVSAPTGQVETNIPEVLQTAPRSGQIAIHLGAPPPVPAAIPPALAQGQYPPQAQPYPVPPQLQQGYNPYGMRQQGGGGGGNTAADQARMRAQQARYSDTVVATARVQGTQPLPGAQAQTQDPLAALGITGLSESQAEIARLTAAATGTGPGASVAGGLPPGVSAGQAEKENFLKASNTQDYLSATRLPALSPYELKAGTVIPGVLITGINSDLPGQITGQVSQNVYDTVTGHYLLIPQGTRLIGTYDSSVSVGQTRLLAAWTRMIYPDGSSVDIGRMVGADPSGSAGFDGHVDNHVFKTFGEAILLSLFSSGAQLSQPQAANGQNIGNGQTLSAGLGQNLTNLGTNVISQNLSVSPSIVVEPGYRFVIVVSQDMILPPWTQQELPGARQISPDPGCSHPSCVAGYGGQ